MPQKIKEEKKYMAKIQSEDFNTQGTVLELAGKEEWSGSEICLLARKRELIVAIVDSEESQSKVIQAKQQIEQPASASHPHCQRKGCDGGYFTSYFIKYSNLNLNIPRGFFGKNLCATSGCSKE